MRTITRLLPAVLLAFAGTAPPCHAQDNVTPTQWTGTAYSSIGTKTFYLYNIGTGKFVKQGGEFGVQGIFMFQGFGTPLTLEKVSGDQYRINSGVETYSSGKYVGINYPGQTSPSVPWDHSQFLFGIIFDTFESYGGFKRFLKFEKIDGYSSPCVYRIKETISKSSIDFYWGAKMGIDYKTGGLSDDLGNVSPLLLYFKNRRKRKGLLFLDSCNRRRTQKCAYVKCRKRRRTARKHELSAERPVFRPQPHRI